MQLDVLYMWRVKPIEVFSVSGWHLHKQTNKQTKWPGTKTKADRTRRHNGLTGFDDHAEQKKRKEEFKKRPGLARQAGMQACSLSELKDPPPRSSHLQVEGEKTLLLNAGLFSGTPCIQPSTKAKLL